MVKATDLVALVARMAAASRLKADTKIGLLEKIATLRSRKLQVEFWHARTKPSQLQ